MAFFDFFRDNQPPLVAEAFEDVRSMLKVGQEMFAAATAHLLDNEILDVDLKELDETINVREQDLRRSVLEHLTIDPGRELIFSLKLVSIVHEAERIGDLAKSISKVTDLAEGQRMGPHVEPLREQRDAVMRMFERAREGFVEADESIARELMQEHERQKDVTTSYLKDLASSDDLSSNEAVVYALAARMMNRVSSHLSNIASTVVSPFDQLRRSPTWSEES